MYRTKDCPWEYSAHVVEFHSSIAHATGNPVLAALVESAIEADITRIRNLRDD